MADEARNALVAQALHIGAVGLVGALHAIAEVEEHLGDAAHADAADADEMHQADCLRHLHRRLASLNSRTVFPDAIASVRSASNRAALGLPTDFAAAAVLASRSGSFIAAPIRAASRSGDKVDCG